MDRSISFVSAIGRVMSAAAQKAWPPFPASARLQPASRHHVTGHQMRHNKTPDRPGQSPDSQVSRTAASPADRMTHSGVMLTSSHHIVPVAQKSINSNQATTALSGTVMISSIKTHSPSVSSTKNFSMLLQVLVVFIYVSVKRSTPSPGMLRSVSVMGCVGCLR